MDMGILKHQNTMFYLMSLNTWIWITGTQELTVATLQIPSLLFCSHQGCCRPTREAGQGRSSSELKLSHVTCEGCPSHWEVLAPLSGHHQGKQYSSLTCTQADVGAKKGVGPELRVIDLTGISVDLGPSVFLWDPLGTLHVWFLGVFGS